MREDKVIPVRVALRCRPLVDKEVKEGCQTCLHFVPGEPQVILSTDRAFTYDFVFSPSTPQADVFDKAVAGLVSSIFNGYNATVIAYGQTGSGKTYTMGGGWSSDCQDDVGVIPRVIQALFTGIETRKEQYTFDVKVSYIEIYKEALLDLLLSASKKDLEELAIREDGDGGVKITGVTEVSVSDAETLLQCLERGAHSRSVGSTAMNNASSRSHAIFTIGICRTSHTDSEDCCKVKFHLVDLAGSERVKRTHAEGDRLKEGIKINCGLLALGNVISALGEDRGRGHIPYRDSKLTRLLQDSLGGNSHTLMIACVSPADSNMDETLSTMRYADRARKIKNKPIVNIDPQAAEIIRLKQLIQQLQNGGAAINQASDSSNLLQQIKQLQNENNQLSHELQQSVEHVARLNEKVIIAEMSHDRLHAKIQQLREKTGLNLTMLNQTTGETDQINENIENDQQMALIQQLHEAIVSIEKETTDNVSVILAADQHHNGTDDEDGDEETGKESSEEGAAYRKEYALRQAELGRELDELNSRLARKQQYAEQIVQSDDNMMQLRTRYEESMAALENEVKKLQKERDDLTIAVNNAANNTAHSKVSEQRRQRLRQLETEMTALRKKIQEQGKMLKLKEANDRQIMKLNTEIQAMKGQRVKLMKQMKEDSDQFRKWRQHKDKEVVQLKAKDRKRQVEMAKLEAMHGRQQNVFRRKVDEALAANKRLKEALNRQHNTATDRRAKQEAGNSAARIKKWLAEDLEVLVSAEEAKHHLNSLIEDRCVLSQQLHELREKRRREPAAKKQMLNDSSSKDSDNDKIQSEITSLQQDLDLRNVQISDLQQKLMDVDQEEKGKCKWEALRTMAEAKCGLQWLLQTAMTAKLEGVQAQSMLRETQLKEQEARQRLEEAIEEMRQYSNKLDDQQLAAHSECKKRELFLLSQLRQHVDGTLVDNCENVEQQAAQQEIQRLRATLDEVTQEKKAIFQELTIAKYNLTVGGTSAAIDDGNVSRFFSDALTPEMNKIKRRSKRMTMTLQQPSFLSAMDVFAEEPRKRRTLVPKNLEDTENE